MIIEKEVWQEYSGASISIPIASFGSSIICLLIASQTGFYPIELIGGILLGLIFPTAILCHLQHITAVTKKLRQQNNVSLTNSNE